MLSELIVRKANVNDLKQLSLKHILNLAIGLIVSSGLLTIMLVLGINPTLKFILGLPLLLSVVALVISLLGTLLAAGQLFGIVQPDSAKGETWVAIYLEKVIAEAHVGICADYTHLYRVEVKPDFQRQGVGSLMIRTLSENVMKPVYVCKLARKSTQSELIDFYLRLGFSTVRNQDLPMDLRKYASRTTKDSTLFKMCMVLPGS